MPAARALVVASLAGASNISSLQTPGFTLLDEISQSGGTQGAMSNIAAQGVVEGGTDIDVTFNTNTGVPFAGTAAAFTVQ